MSSQPNIRLTPEEYLEIERRAEYKSEYFDGEVFAMSGASPRHVLIVTNIVRDLSMQLKKRPCRVYSTDLRLRVSPTGLYTYPDVIVTCGDERFADDHRDTLLNPVVIIEVLSESTKDYDRGGKFAHYRALDSLAEYLTVAQDKPHLEHHVRQSGGGWLLTETDRVADLISLPAIDCELALAEVYDKVEF